MAEFTYYKRNEETGEMIEVSEYKIVSESSYHLNLITSRDNWVSQKSASDRLATNRRTQLCSIEDKIAKLGWEPKFNETSANEAIDWLINNWSGKL